MSSSLPQGGGALWPMAAFAGGGQGVCPDVLGVVGVRVGEIELPGKFGSPKAEGGIDRLQLTGPGKGQTGAAPWNIQFSVWVRPRQTPLYTRKVRPDLVLYYKNRARYLPGVLAASSGRCSRCARLRWWS